MGTDIKRLRGSNIRFVQDKDRYPDERRDKHWQRGKRKEKVKTYCVEKESVLWQEHKEVMKRAGVDVESLQSKRKILGG